MKTQSLQEYEIKNLKFGDLLVANDWFQLNMAKELQADANIDPLLGIFDGWFAGAPTSPSSTEVHQVERGELLLYIDHKDDPLGRHYYFLHNEMKFALRGDEFERFIDFFDVVLMSTDCNP